MISIDHDVPLPRRAVGTPPSEIHDALLALQPGDSFLVPADFVKRLRWAIAYVRRQHGRRYTTRTMTTGVRVWRVE